MNPFHDISIGGILPQREPFVFVDRLEHYDDVETVTSFTVREGHLMVQDGVLSAPGILENMAQSSAARIGYLCKYILHVPVRIGYIGAIRKFRVGISLVDATVRVGEEIIAEAALKTALGEKEAE